MRDCVLVTGASGFIAKHVICALLEAGYDVRATVRSQAGADRVKVVVRDAGHDPARVAFLEADLNSDASWQSAATGCRFVQHIASPFPLRQPRDREALVPVARDGTIRVIDAALSARVERIVLVSSALTMIYRAGRPATITVTESDWTDPEWPRLSAYIVSKTRAERPAWDEVRLRGTADKLCVVNPGLVFGPALDRDIGSSLGIIAMMLKGTYPALPASAYPIVDVRDLAQVHVKAMTTPSASGRRLIAAGETLSMPEMAAILRAELGGAARRVPTRTLPAFLVRLLSLVDPTLKSAVPDIGTRPIADSAYVTAMTGVSFRSARDAILASARSLIAHGLV